jgi:hypothetical protein
MFIGLQVDDREYVFSDTKRVWSAINYGHSWGLDTGKGIVFIFSEFKEMLMFIANEEKLWVRG